MKAIKVVKRGMSLGQGTNLSMFLTGLEPVTSQMLVGHSNH